MTRACSGLALVLLALTLGCATTEGEEIDPFVPPSRPILYSDCPPGGAQRKPRSALGRPARDLPRTVRLPVYTGEPIEGPLVVTHGGAGSPSSTSDGPERAARLALERLAANAGALDAAVDATARMEDDPRFNAGTGSIIRLDGKTIQMDASLMTGEGAFAAVAVIERVRNPIRIARAVLDTPHILLAGDGATRFAHRMGFEDVVPTSTQSEARYQERMKRLREERRRAGLTTDWTTFWNFPNPVPPELGGEHGDTVGTVVRDAEGRFAVTLSTGGTSFTLNGRVGDVPIFGAGGYAGPEGAVACTGEGELIVKQLLARRVYEAIAAGVPARQAAGAAVAEFPNSSAVGIIAVDRVGYGVAANRSMAFGVAYDRPE